MVALTAAAVGLAGGVIWAAVSPAQTAAVKLEAHATAGDNPFMPPVGDDEASVTPPTGAAGTFSGGTPGLYGQNGDRPSCDTATLVSNLQADPTKEAAWASALNIRADEIPSYAQSLSPVLLRADTAVTAHGYDAPRYVSYPAVLQAGSAVFVNAFGEPTVKCFNGNPLTQGVQFADASYSGAQWSYFRPGGYTYVRPNRVVINVYNYYDLPKKFIRKFESWCSHHHGAEGCRFPNPKHWCEDDENRKGCKAARGAGNHASSGAANHAKPDLKLEANAKKAKDDAATADDAAKKAAGKAQDLEQQAAALKASAESLPEPARSVELARAAQLDQAAKQARADADAKAAEAKKAADAADAAAQTRAESDKAVATTTTGETTTGDATTQGTTADTNTDGPTTGDGATSVGGPTTGGDTTTGATTGAATGGATGGATSGTSTTGPPTTGGSSPFGAVTPPTGPCRANPQLPQCTAGTSGTSTTGAGNSVGGGSSDSGGGSSDSGGSSGKNDKNGSGG